MLCTQSNVQLAPESMSVSHCVRWGLKEGTHGHDLFWTRQKVGQSGVCRPPGESARDRLGHTVHDRFGAGKLEQKCMRPTRSCP